LKALKNAYVSESVAFIEAMPIPVISLYAPAHTPDHADTVQAYTVQADTVHADRPAWRCGTYGAYQSILHAHACLALRNI
jgi:hypothetical protein